MTAERARAATPRRRSRSTASTSSKAPTSSTSRCTSATAIPYDYHRLLYTFRVKSRTQGRRHLPAAAHVGVSPGDVKFKRPDWTADAAALARSSRGARAAGQTDRLHQRRLRSAPPRPRPLPPGGARATATLLIVGVNSDRSVRAQQGPGAADQSAKPNAPKCSRRSLRRRGRDLRRGHAARDHRRAAAGRARQGRRLGRQTRSSAATSSRRAAAGRPRAASSRAIRRPRSSRAA